MLHRVALGSIHQLQAFERKIVHGQASLLYHPDRVGESGKLVQILTIQGYKKGADLGSLVIQWMSLVATIVLACPLLRSFTLLDLPVTQACMACLFRTSVNNITSITCCIDSHHLHSTGIFDYINRLPKLEQLYIKVFRFSADLDASAWESQTALNAVSIKMISWTMRAKDFRVTESLLRYISRCRVNHAAHLRLDLSYGSAQQAALVMPFFDAHRLESLSLRCPENFTAALAPHMSQIAHVSAPYTTPPLQLLEAGPLPSNLTIGIEVSDHERDVANFWEFLRRMPRRDGPAMKLLIVTTRWGVSSPTVPERKFRWSDGAMDEYAAFMGKLVAEAIRLYDEGVIIVDGQGRDIAGLVRK
jgi:hypothetical protein